MTLKWFCIWSMQRFILLYYSDGVLSQSFWKKIIYSDIKMRRPYTIIVPTVKVVLPHENFWSKINIFFDLYASKFSVFWWSFWWLVHGHTWTRSWSRWRKKGLENRKKYNSLVMSSMTSSRWVIPKIKAVYLNSVELDSDTDFAPWWCTRAIRQFSLSPPSGQIISKIQTMTMKIFFPWIFYQNYRHKTENFLNK